MLNGFRKSLTKFEDLPGLVDQAKDIMGIGTGMVAFANDTLRIEISGPDRPALTIVDLPGLIHSKTKSLTDQDVKLVNTLVRSYMDDERSIILAVVAASNDIANLKALDLAKTVDPDGARTLGIITKPDIPPIWSGSEASFVDLAGNMTEPLRLGWHVLRNRDFKTRNTTQEERDDAERAFFEEGLWKNLPRNSVAIGPLRIRLSKLFLDQIRDEVPHLLDEIDYVIVYHQEKLDKLGGQRTTEKEQRTYLLKVSQGFQDLVTAAMNGAYHQRFFITTYDNGPYDKNLRAVVQNLNIEFAETMRVRGHRVNIIDVVDGAEIISYGEDSEDDAPLTLSRDDQIEDITQLLKHSRGKELPGMINPMVVAMLFAEHCGRWGHIARTHLRKVGDAMNALLELALAQVTDDSTATNLLRKVIDPQVRARDHAAVAKLEELLAREDNCHPITYNKSFTDTVHKMRQQRDEAYMRARLSDMMKEKDAIPSLSWTAEPDMDRLAAGEVLDYMLAFYKVGF